MAHEGTRVRWTVALLLGCTFATGVVDAVGYLGLDRVFVGNMTGNVAILGMALAGGGELPVLGPAVALLGFVVGAVLAGRALRSRQAGWSGRAGLLLVVAGAVFAAVTVVLALAGAQVVGPDDAGGGPPWLVAVTTVMAVAMGVQAATARRIAVADLTTVVVTSTLTGLAADSRLAGASGAQWRRRAGAILVLVAGAAVGALLLRVHLAVGPGLAAVVLVAVAVAGRRALPTSG
ncbi:DUF1275 domain-containing protein [Modestobacter roseus]|nr:DUF1275 domain-containing protein [Modestobacter roseus]